MSAPYVDPRNIIECCKATVALTENNRFYVSILTMKNLLSHKDGYPVRPDPKHEKEECQGGHDCFLKEYQALKNVLVMTLNVEKGGVRTKFEVRTFDNHCVQNCEVTAMYLKYLYQNCKHGKHNRFNDSVIKNSNKLYSECSSDFIESGYGPRNIKYDESEFPVVGKKILPRPSPVIKGIPFSDVLKLGIENKNSNLGGTDILEDEDVDGIIESITLLQEENEDLKNKNSLLLKTLEERDDTITKLNLELNVISTKFKKLQVVLSALKSKK